MLALLRSRQSKYNCKTSIFSPDAKIKMLCNSTEISSKQVYMYFFYHRGQLFCRYFLFLSRVTVSVHHLVFISPFLSSIFRSLMRLFFSFPCFIFPFLASSSGLLSSLYFCFPFLVYILVTSCIDFLSLLHLILRFPSLLFCFTPRFIFFSFSLFILCSLFSFLHYCFIYFVSPYTMLHSLAVFLFSLHFLFAFCLFFFLHFPSLVYILFPIQSDRFRIYLRKKYIHKRKYKYAMYFLWCMYF